MLNYAAFYFSKMVITTTQTAQIFLLITGKLSSTTVVEQRCVE